MFCKRSLLVFGLSFQFTLSFEEQKNFDESMKNFFLLLFVLSVSYLRNLFSQKQGWSLGVREGMGRY